jgi:ribosomal protein L28
MFKRTVLTPLHKKRWIEYDTDAGTVTISPLGIKEVEEKILKPAAD